MLQSKRYATCSRTPASQITLVATHRSKSFKLCTIHKPPQFSMTGAWCVSRKMRLAKYARLLSRADTGSPRWNASRSSASCPAVA